MLFPPQTTWTCNCFQSNAVATGFLIQIPKHNYFSNQHSIKVEQGYFWKMSTIQHTNSSAFSLEILNVKHLYRQKYNRFTENQKRLIKQFIVN